MESPETPVEKRTPKAIGINVFRVLLKTFMWIVVSLVVLLATAIALVFIYEDEVKEAMIGELNKHLNAEIKIDPENIDLTVVRSFPHASIEFKDALCYEALKKEKRDTLFTAKKISLQFSLFDLFNKHYNIKSVDLYSIDMRLRVNKKGAENYIIWKEDTTSAAGES